MAETLRTEKQDGVFSIVLTRAAEYNTITLELRDELAAAIDDGDKDPDSKVILLRAEGPAFCAGYGLDWATAAPAASPAGDEDHAARIRSRAASSRSSR